MAQKYSLQVRCGPRAQTFKVLVHARFDPCQFHLDPVELYLRHGNGVIPDIPHYEIEIVEPGEEVLKKFNLHAWRSRLDPTRIFINWPGHNPDRGMALQVFKVWAVGSMGMMNHTVDINDVLEESEYDVAEFCSFMLRTYSVSCEQEPRLIR